MLGIAKLRSIQYQDANNRISNPTDLAAKLPSNESNLIFIMLDMVSKRWRAGICNLTAKTAALLIAHPPILLSVLCSFALDAIQTTLIGS